MRNTLASIIRLFIQLTMLFFAFLMLPENPVDVDSNIVESTPEKDTKFMNTKTPFYRMIPGNSSFISAHTESEQRIAINN